VIFTYPPIRSYIGNLTEGSSDIESRSCQATSAKNMSTHLTELTLGYQKKNPERLVKRGSEIRIVILKEERMYLNDSISYAALWRLLS
jgi:hypothetical protein